MNGPMNSAIYYQERAHTRSMGRDIDDEGGIVGLMYVLLPRLKRSTVCQGWRLTRLRTTGVHKRALCRLLHIVLKSISAKAFSFPKYYYSSLILLTMTMSDKTNLETQTGGECIE
jgi:hypothetical protein